MNSAFRTIPTFDLHAALPCWTVRDGDVEFAFSTRLGGVSIGPYDSLNLGRSTADDPAAVTENRRRILDHLGITPDRLATASQVHGARVVRVDTPGLIPDCDALLTTEPGLAIAVTAADCVPLVCVGGGAVAVVHSGWRGTVEGMPREAVLALCAAAGIEPAQVCVHIGPSIRSCCFTVGEDVARCFPDAACRRVNDAWHVDLPAAVRIQLAETGIDMRHLSDLGECTACHTDRYFSHRREHGITGRQWAVALRHPAGGRRV